jgi:hypothetical protein
MFDIIGEKISLVSNDGPWVIIIGWKRYVMENNLDIMMTY